MFAEVIINLPVSQTFHYRIPLEMSDLLTVGQLVEVSFGRQLAQAIVVNITNNPPAIDADFKHIERIISEQPVMTRIHLELARLISERYYCDIASSVRLFLPPGLSKRGDMLYRLAINGEFIETENDNQALIVNLLSIKGERRGRQIARSLSRRNWQKAMQDLIDRGLVFSKPVLDPPSISVKEVNRAEITIDPDRLADVLVRDLDPAVYPLSQRRAIARRKAVLDYLAGVRRAVTVSEVYKAVEGSNLTDLRYLSDEGYIDLRREQIWRDPLDDFDLLPDIPPILSPEQEGAWEEISHQLDEAKPQPILVHGVTGSGKTELYIRAVDKVLRSGKSAIVLIPEISLTPQTIQRFGVRFPRIIGVMHSGLSDGEQYDTWRRITSGEIRVVVGPRSALFSPTKDLGLIVIDECHDDSYKQSSPIPPPYYHALQVALLSGDMHGALVLLGSATPGIETVAESSLPGEGSGKRFIRLILSTRIHAHRQAMIELASRLNRPSHVQAECLNKEALSLDLPPVDIVDMRDELKQGNRSLFSRQLQDLLHRTLEQNEQAILFLNRRGAATYVFCRDCGYVFTCPKDHIPLTWHQKDEEDGMLLCHYCNFRQKHPSVCPECGSARVKFFGAGTQRVEQDLLHLHPEARVIRWDSDTASQKGKHLDILRQFALGQADVLVGTQMIAKGLDLPLVTLVGIVSADTALNLPDYRSGERTFQVLTQVAGRAGRGMLGGRVVLQTYMPGHYAIQNAARHDYENFYDTEMSYRQRLGYPPFSNLARLVVKGTSEKASGDRAHQIAQEAFVIIREFKLRQTDIIGPAPCYFLREGSSYRWQVVIRGPDPNSILSRIKLANDVQVDVDPVTLL